MELTDIKPQEIEFKKRIFKSSHSLIYLVTVRQISCVLKLYHNIVPEGESTYWLDLERWAYKCETSAYRRMKEAGLCDRGIVPQFYGSIERLNPDDYEPYLDKFRSDLDVGFSDRPSAILLEHITGIENLHRGNYTKARMDKFIECLNIIHDAGVVHEDIHPRNMFVFPDSEDGDKVMWFDFGRAQVLEKDQPNPFLENLIKEENEVVKCLGEAMEADIKQENGRLYSLALWYGVPRGTRIVETPETPPYKI